MYGKIFEDIYGSSLMFESGWKAVYIFSTMIVMADKNGIVNIDPRALYRTTGMEIDEKVSFEDFEKCIAELEKPDPQSNLKTFEGRRIIPLNEIEQITENRGWLIVNAKHYRDKRCKEDRQDYMKNYMSDYRKQNKFTDVNSKQSLTQLANTDTDTDTDTDNLYIKTKQKKLIKPTIEEIQQYLNERKLTDINAEQFFNFYEASNWMRGKTKIKNWKACINTWNNNKFTRGDQNGARKKSRSKSVTDKIDEFGGFKDCIE